MRDAAMTFHFARYSGVSFGASAPRPCEPSAVGDERVGGARVSQAARDLRAFVLDRRVALEAERVDLIGRERQGRPRQDRGRVDARATGDGRHSDRLGGVRQVLAEHLEERLVPGVHDVADDLGDALARRVVVGRHHRGRVLDREREEPLDLTDRSLGDDARAAGPSAASVDVAVIQPVIEQTIKWDPVRHAEIIAIHEQLTRDARRVAVA